MTITLQALISNNNLGLVPKDLKQFKKLLNLSKTRLSGKGDRLPVTVCLISAGLAIYNLSNTQFNPSFFYEGQNLLNKRALVGLLKPTRNYEKSNLSWQIRGTALSVTSFSGDLSLSNASNTCHKASKMRLCYQIAQQIHKMRPNVTDYNFKNPYNLLGALVISKNHKWFIDSTELKQGLALQPQLAHPAITLKHLICVLKRSARQKANAKLTLMLCNKTYAKYTL